MSRLLLACAPPLMTFIIGTGITGSRAPPPSRRVPVQRQPASRAAACALASDTASMRVGAEAALVVGAVELDHARVEAGLVARIAPESAAAQHGVDVLDRLEHALAAVALRVAVAQLDGLARAGGGARGHRRAAERAGVQHHVGFDRGVAARVEDLAAANVDDAAHRRDSSKGTCFTARSSCGQGLEQRLHALERPGIRTVRERLCRIAGGFP